ncbi:MAG: hypothetical protein NTZ73_04335 [Candidatus Diapherotrites archaeon]|nr:hypothetical protein [Candidatus Diapherotrites archaeon]
MEIYLILAVILFFASIIGGVFSLKKYLKTKKKIFLIFGIILTFVVPGIILLFVILPSTMVSYGPAPPNTMIEYGPAPPK